jgi:lipid II:glycine glycyltransferase (peptidoglycan interpeptide bridge formation enzyme)
MIRLATDAEIQNWDELVTANPDGGHIYQSFEWSQVKSFHDWEPVFCVYEAPAVFIAFVLLRKAVSMLGNIYYCSKGPGVFAGYKADEKTKAHFEEILLDLEKFVAKQDSKAILVKVEPELEDGQLDLAKLGLVKASADLQFKATILVDIKPSEEEILNSFKQKTRYNIRLAERKGVKVEQRPMNDDGVDLMYELMQATQEDIFCKLLASLVRRRYGAVFSGYPRRRCAWGGVCNQVWQKSLLQRRRISSNQA